MLKMLRMLGSLRFYTLRLLGNSRPGLIGRHRREGFPPPRRFVAAQIWAASGRDGGYPPCLKRTGGRAT